MSPHIMVYGNPSDGFRFVGPFDTKRKALDYCAHEPGNAWVAELDAPSPLLGDLDGFERLAKSIESIPTNPSQTAADAYAAWLANQPKPKTMAEALAQLPPGVTGVMLDGSQASTDAMINAVADAVGEPEARVPQGVIRRMTCCVCGDDAGRWSQHWNRDHGFGICGKCVTWLRQEGRSTEEEILSLYGKEGINWGCVS